MSAEHDEQARRVLEEWREAGRSRAEGWGHFDSALDEHFPRLYAFLLPLYGHLPTFRTELHALLDMMARLWSERSISLKALDEERRGDPQWFESQRMVGGVCYVDLFAGSIEGVRQRIPYLKELGLTYLHLMPLFKAPEGENDGGYAISSYREVDPHLGTMDDLARLAADLREAGISLVLDFVFNHTSDEHDWALRALQGDPEHSSYYYIFPDRVMPDAYERTLREIFPDRRPGNFTYRPEIDSWVWTTFHSFQWDLNYSNPVVFRRMAEEMLQLANRGAEVLRLDAVAFAWKELGTACESLPQVHLLVRAFNQVARIAAPALLFKSEAIVHPAQVAEYISPEECQISYNPLLMALEWEALATRQTELLKRSMQRYFAIPAGCAWVNYVRSHDDIGWTFDDDDARIIGRSPWHHRQYLNAFYMGRFPGSFARGLPFQENPRTGDARISGTCASLAGLESALQSGSRQEIEAAIRRILMLYGIAFAMGGIPLIYLGDEWATLNDYSYRLDPARAEDSRWVHRPRADWERAERRHDPSTPEGRIFDGVRRLSRARKACSALAGSATEIAPTGNEHIFGFLRGVPDREGSWVLVLSNFSEHAQSLRHEVVANYRGALLAQGGESLADLLTGERLSLTGELTLPPYTHLWLTDAYGQES